MSEYSNSPQGRVKRTMDDLHEYEAVSWQMYEAFTKAMNNIVPKDESPKAKHMYAMLRMASEKLFASASKDYHDQLKARAKEATENLLKRLQ